MRAKYRRALFVPGIIAVNIAVFLMWHFDSYDWMLDNFAVSWVSVEEGRYWTLLTSIFSHNMLLHLFINMFVLSSFGSLLEVLLGRMRFLNFYLFAGVTGSVTHAVVSNVLIHRPDQLAVGASGAIAGLILLFSLVFPREKIFLFGILPLPAIFGALAFIGLDLWGLMAQTQGGGLPIGHGAHLGGAFAGIVYYFVLRSQKTKRPNSY